MSIYMSRLFRSSNSSILLQSGTALQAEAVRLREKTLLVDSGFGSPKICSLDEATIKPDNPKTRFETKVGSMGVSSGAESLIQKVMLERFFIDLVAGDSVMKERASANFNDSVGATETVPGEPVLLLPRKFRQNRAWMELNKIWRMNSRVKGFVLAKGRGGYAVAIAGYVGFLPFRRGTGIYSDRFVIESINSKTRNLVVFNQGVVQKLDRWQGRQPPIPLP